MFKVINHIDDIWPFVQDVEGITLNVKEEEGFQVINYQFVTPTTFDIPEALEARGIKFDLDGNIIARPFHKFFNLFEKQGIDELDWDIVASVETKWDGSMIHPVLLPYGPKQIRLMTRAGFSEQAQLAYDTAMTPNLEAEMLSYILNGYTPLYEFVSPNNRIVVKYEKPQLQLLAVRHMKTGEYIGLDWQGMNETPQELLERVKALKGDEGVVVVWPNGHRIKIKADEYVTLHRAKAMLEREINVIRCIFEGVVDDLVASVNEEDRERLKEYIKGFHEVMSRVAIEADTDCDMYALLSQKDFAMFVLKEVAKPLQGLWFKMRERGNYSPMQVIMDYMNKRLIKQDRVDELAEMFGETRWEY